MDEQNFHDILVDYLQSERKLDDMQNTLFLIIVLFALDKKSPEEKQKISEVLKMIK